MLRKKRLTNFFQYIFVIALILECRSVWSRLISMEGWLDYVIYGSMIVSTVMCVLLNKMTKSELNYILQTGAILFLLGFLYVLVTPTGKLGLLKFMCLTFMCLIFYSVCSFDYGKDILMKYANIIYFIAVESLICWMLISVLHIWNTNTVVFSSWSGAGSAVPINSFFGLYYETQSISALSMIRNSAVFTEAPMCSFHFCCALIINLFIIDKITLKRTIILTFAVISTLSTTGIVVAVCAWLLYYFINKCIKANRTSQIIRTMMFPVLIAATTIFLVEIVGKKIDSVSGIYRLMDIKGGLQAWFSNPVFGVGFGNASALAIFTGKIGYSNSIVQILAYGGIVLSLPYFLAIFNGIICSIKQKKYKTLSFVILYFMLLCTTLVTFQYLCVMLMFICNRCYQMDVD